MQKLFKKKHNNIGITLQSYLYRSEDDLKSLLDIAPYIRLVKGAYAEDSSVSMQNRNEIYDNYKVMQSHVIFDKDSKQRDKYFLLLNRAPRIHRMAFISWLHGKDLLKDTFTSFPTEELAPYNFSKKIHLSQYFSNTLTTSSPSLTNFLSIFL